MNGNFVDILLDKFREKTLSHVYLIETNDLNRTYNSIIELTKHIQCTGVYSNNCGKCNVCSLIDSFNNPNVITLEADGVNIKKEQVNELQRKFRTKPILSNYNIYIIKGAEYLNESSENSLLKFLEEPEDYILGFLITENEDKLLSTITSRCQKLYDFKNNDRLYDENIISIANNYYDIMFSNPLKLLLVNKDSISFINSRELLSDFFQYILEKYILDTKELDNRILLLLKSILNDIKYNVNVELVLDKFLVEMSDICG